MAEQDERASYRSLECDGQAPRTHHPWHHRHEPAAPRRPLDRGAAGAAPHRRSARRRPRLRGVGDHDPRTARPAGPGAARRAGGGHRDRSASGCGCRGGYAATASRSSSAASRSRPTAPPAVIRALNVLRQYDESEVAAAWATMTRATAAGRRARRGDLRRDRPGRELGGARRIRAPDVHDLAAPRRPRDSRRSSPSACRRPSSTATSPASASTSCSPSSTGSGRRGSPRGLRGESALDRRRRGAARGRDGRCAAAARGGGSASSRSTGTRSPPPARTGTGNGMRQSAPAAKKTAQARWRPRVKTSGSTPHAMRVHPIVAASMAGPDPERDLGDYDCQPESEDGRDMPGEAEGRAREPRRPVEGGQVVASCERADQPAPRR